MARPSATRCRWPPESCAGLPIEEVLDVEHVGPRRRARAISPFVPDTEGEVQVLAHGHVRIERVVLEHHR